MPSMEIYGYPVLLYASAYATLVVPQHLLLFDIGLEICVAFSGMSFVGGTTVSAQGRSKLFVALPRVAWMAEMESECAVQGEEAIYQ
jgi:hypothetical protein